MSYYFRKLPNLNYPSPLKTRESNLDVVQSKNLFRRAKVREDLFANFMQFDRYKITGDERPDNVAERVYGNNNLDWVVLITNNIIDINNFNKYKPSSYGWWFNLVCTVNTICCCISCDYFKRTLK